MRQRAIDEFELHSRLRNQPRVNPRRRPQYLYTPPPKRPTVHSAASFETTHPINLETPRGFVRELTTLAGTVLKNKMALIRKKIGTFGRDMLNRRKRAGRKQPLTGPSTKPPPDPRWREDREMFEIPPLQPEDVEVEVESDEELPDEPQPPEEQSPGLEKLSLAQQGSVSMIGGDPKRDKQYRNLTIFFTGVYCAIFLLLILFRVLVPALTITGTLFAGFFVTLFGAICAVIAWAYMTAIVGKVFFAAFLLSQLAYSVLLAAQLRWGTLIGCTVALVVVYLIAVISTLLSNAATRKGTEAVGVGFMICLVMCLFWIPYFLGVGGFGNLAWILFVAAFVVGVFFVYAIWTFYWEADTKYDGLDYGTGGIWAFGVLSFAGFLFLVLLMGMFISLRTHGLSIGIPLFWTDVVVGQITIPAAVFSAVF